MVERNARPDAILFADTGGERPATYAYTETLAGWIATHDLPPITVVAYRPGTGDRSLEDELNRRKALPALAYGWKTCSLKWKREPCERWIKQTYGDRPVKRAIGYDAGEHHRHARADDSTWLPLVDWGWDRSACVAAIQRAGLELPPKSSCFFCPANKRDEILELRDEHPDLYQRALRIEQDAIDNGQTSGSTKGLGRSFRWAALEDAPRQPEIDFPCDCGI